MESFKIENLSFCYPERSERALENINLTINQGEFVTLCGISGCGKTTLLRLLKPEIAPFGEILGKIYFCGRELNGFSKRELAENIGFIMQDPDNQIVTDKVWHELAFGLESLGYSSKEIRMRVSEMASFFGIQTWFHKKVNELSGGQKQLLNLASVMVMQPSVLILDEPTSQLDPIAAQEFLNTLKKINCELGTTVILTEHRLEETFAVSDRVVVMEKGSIIADDVPWKIGEILAEKSSDMYDALPTPMRIFMAAEDTKDSKVNIKPPLNVREGKKWLDEYFKIHNIPVKSESLNIDKTNNTEYNNKSKTKDHDYIIELKNLRFAYNKNLPDVIKGLDANIKRGEFFAILGGNGTGKSTALSLISGINTPYRGSIKIDGKNIKDIKDLYSGVLGVMPQDPKSLFVKKTLYQDLKDMLIEERFYKDKEKNNKYIHDKLVAAAKLCNIENLLESHPFDLSGGEQQRAALAKILLKDPKILLLDEPTKGMDAHFKKEFAEILKSLKAYGVTVVMVSHDIEFCAENADTCAMFFDGAITSTGKPKEFFGGKNFYTTVANRMSRTVLENAILTTDVLLACGADNYKNADDITKDGIYKDENVCEVYFKNFYTPTTAEISADKSNDIKQPESMDGKIVAHKENKENIKNKQNKYFLYGKKIIGVIFSLLFAVTSTYLIWEKPACMSVFLNYISTELLQILNIAELGVALYLLIPKKQYKSISVRPPKSNDGLAKRTVMSALFILLAIPFTIYVGSYYFGDRKYYFISLLIILEVLIPFFALFEKRSPMAREIVVISVLCGIGVAGRSAFYMIPQFKPVTAIVIISGLCFGGETGFLVGAVTGFVSNFFFGQGPWTPWQMFSFGIIGFFAGTLFKIGLIRRTRMSISVFGFVATMLIYGGIMNFSNVILYQEVINKEMIISSYAMGIPFDLIHGVSTFFFLWFLSEPMIDKLERVKLKYGLVER